MKKCSCTRDFVIHHRARFVAQRRVHPALKGFGEAPEARHVAVGGRKATILWDGRTRTAVAYAPEVEGPADESATLTAGPSDPETPWVDQETSSRWSIAGRAVFGPRKGRSLRWLPGLMVKWYAWAATYPGTTLDG